MTHAPHADITTHGLQPGCPRCEEIAQRPVQLLDADEILRLLDGRWHSALDERAAAKLRQALEEGQRLLDLLGEASFR